MIGILLAHIGYERSPHKTRSAQKPSRSQNPPFLLTAPGGLQVPQKIILATVILWQFITYANHILKSRL